MIAELSFVFTYINNNMDNKTSIKVSIIESYILPILHSFFSYWVCSSSQLHYTE